MKTEYWDLLDEAGRRTGERVRRGLFNRFESGRYHLVVHIWIKNSKGEFLIQQRSKNKEPMAGEWAATSGAVISGETAAQAAVRELHEELGILVKTEELHYLARFKRKVSITDIWWVGVDASLDSLVLQREEVTKAMWVTKERLREMIGAGEFHNYGADYFDAVFRI